LRTALRKQGQNFLKTGELGDEIFEALSEMYKSVSANYLRQQYNWLERDIRKMDRFFMGWELWTAEQIASKLKVAADSINDTTKKWIRDAQAKEVERRLAEGIAAGSEIEVLQSAIQHVTDGVIGKNRAKVIARTELGQAVNDAKKKASDDWSDETGTKQGKLWVHRGAPDPRSWHLALDTGVPIPKDQPFIVANPNTGVTDYMDRPHDVGASAENVVNCGCTVIYTRLE
jgi:hypothetical protein